MKVVLAGAFGNLGSDILRCLVERGHEVVAVGRKIRKIDGIKGKYTSKQVDIKNKESLKGICDGAEIVISTVGLTSSSKSISNYDVDYKGNLNLLEEAEKAGVRNFVYVSVLKSDGDKTVPMLHAKYLMEEEIKKSNLQYVIFRPTGYFYDLAKVFMPMIEKGSVSLLGKKAVYANPIDTTDLADFIVEHMEDKNCLYDIGGKESYSYEEIARMFFEAANKQIVIKRAPVWLFSVLAWMAKVRKTGKESIIRFSKWTLSNEMVASTMYGNKSFKEYIKSSYK